MDKKLTLWQHLLHFCLWVVCLGVGYFVLVGITYGLGGIPELFGATGESLQWWSWGLRLCIALIFGFATFWLLFHPIRARRAVGAFVKTLYSRFIPIKKAETPPVSTSTVNTGEIKPISRRRFLTESSALTAFTGYSFFAEANAWTVNRVELKLRDLPSAFEGFTIAQITDIHIDSYSTPVDVSRFVDRVNSFKPDLTVVTGDFIFRGTYYFDMAAETLGKLQEGSRMGVYGVSGNHDFWSDSDLGRIEPALKKNGIPLIRNSATELRLNGDSLWLLGTDDSTTHNADWGKTIKSLGYQTVQEAQKDVRPKILLSHNPNFIEQAKDTNNCLMLSGHTHGGQVYLPGVMDLVMQPIFPRYRGLYNIGEFQLYINNGYGTVGPPLRFLTRPEITLIRLTRESYPK